MKSLTGSSSSNSSSSSSTNSSSNERRTTPKSKSTDFTDSSSSKLNFKPYELSSRSKTNDSDKSSDKSTNGSSKAHLLSPETAQTSPDLQKQQANSSSSAPLSYTSLGLPDMHKDSLAAFYKAYGFLAPNCCPTTPGSPYASLMPPPITLDKTGAYPSIYPPTPSATAAAALAAYNYARVKGGMAMMPSTGNLCRDPYCGGACGQFGTLHNSHAALLASQASLALRDSTASSASSQSVSSPCTPATCPNGCNQCEHQRYLAAIASAYGSSFPGLAPGMPYPPQMSASYASSLAAAAALHHRTASTTGNVCNWIVGDAHCGKRFATSEELLQHLKSHTASTNSSESGGSNTATSTASSAHLPSSNSPVVSTGQHLSTSGAPSALSQSVRHSTGSNAAAVSPSLSLHSNRYHPYSKPVSSVAPSLPPSALASAFSMAPNGAASPYPGPFGLSPAAAAQLAPFSASNLYYPYMAPNLFSGRIGPPVPP